MEKGCETRRFVNPYFGTFLSYARNIRQGVRRLVLCQGHAELKIKKTGVKTISYDLPKLHHYNPSSFGANVHLRQMFFKSSRDATPWSTYGNSKGHLRFPCTPNMVEFRALFPELRHLKNGESVSRTEPVFEVNLAPSKERSTYEFRSNSGIFFIEFSC